MAEETLYDSEALRRFGGMELGDDRIPDETTILNFCHQLERHSMTEAVIADVNAHMADKGITLRSGTLVVPRAKVADCMRTSLPRNGEAAPAAGLKPR